MKIIGITGGVGCGKSRVLRFLEEKYGAVCVRADEVSKGLMKKGGICYGEVRELFGDGAVGPDGEFDRQKIAALIFGDEELRLAMNGIMHPAVRRAIMDDILRRKTEEAEKRRENARLPEGIYVLEAALLLEENYDEICSEVWYVYADENVRRRRLSESRGYSGEKITSIMKSQKSERYFREHTDLVIDNSGDFSDTEKQIDAAVLRLSEGGAEGAGPR